MKNIKYLISIFLLVVVANSCQKFDDLEADPNRPATVPPSLVLRGVLKDLYYAPWSDEQRWNQYWCSNYNYYDNNEYWTGSAGLRYTTLKNVGKMEDEALRIGLNPQNSFSVTGDLLRAYFYYDMTMKVGDIPLSQALKGQEDVTPAYDTQKEVFKQILTWLEVANTGFAALIAGGQTSNDAYYFREGDFYFNGDLQKWQNATNALRLRVLAQLSKKEGDIDLNIKQEFAKIMGDAAKYPLMEGNGDNLQFLFNSVSDKYPFNPDNFGFYADRYNTSATYVNTLASLKDPRVFVVAEPAATKLAAGYTAQDFEAYVGAPSDEGLDDMATKVQKGDYSRINKARYFSNYQGEASIQIGYSEMCFNIAEGINRGWASGDAKSWYEKGITASMNFYGITDASAISAYLNRPESGYKGDNADGLNQILVQKYLAMSQHSGFEGYFNWRRTGVPAFFQGGPGTGNSGLIPRRFQYPTSERDNNTQNYQTALDRQFGKKDDSINDELWIVK